MRYQERIYIQNANGAVKNKDILNVNMSSDICIFEAPQFNLSGASKIDCTGFTGTSYVISSATTIPLAFQFTANTETFSALSATFKYEIYKFNHTLESFTTTPTYQSSVIGYSAFSATNETIQLIPVSGLSLDGDYLVKGYYVFSACTFFENALGKVRDTLAYKNGSEYGLYDSNLDWHFIAINQADTPLLTPNGSNTPPSGQLAQQIIFPTDGQTNILITNDYVGAFMLTLNGITLAPTYDYTISGAVVTLLGPAVSGDIITVTYTSTAGNNLVGDNIAINAPVVSGVTNGEGTNSAYFNTTTGKFEIYTSVNPSQGGAIVVMLNGVTLSSGIDYYQSSTNPKRIILEGDIILNDLFTLVYFPRTNATQGLQTSTPVITWSISNLPQLVNGFFSLQVSTGETFNTLFYSGNTPYNTNLLYYSDTFTASGSVGDIIYYRIKNEKNYETLCGDILQTISYSETIPLTIQTNSINTY